METSTQIGKRRILVADDNAMLRRALQIVLELWGFEVTVVEDGSAALTAARQAHHAAIVMDIRMPEIDGLEVARRIRADPRSSTVLLLALSGSGEPEDRSAALAAGFDHHLVKPVDPDLLRKLLEGTPAPATEGDPVPSRR
jgi:CheY-like chemotaxis protein